MAPHLLLDSHICDQTTVAHIRTALQVYKAYKDDVQEVAVKIFKPEEGGAQAVESSKFQMEIAIMKGERLWC